jgi:diguanylate cyclase (GGDEF)-like protein/PAS domain S-box-containing protein
MKFDHSTLLGREVPVLPMVNGALPDALPAQRERSEYWRMLVHAVMQTDDSVVITTVFGIIQFVNPAFERSTGYSAQEAVGRTPALVKSGQHAPEFFAVLWKSMRKNGDIYYEEKTITPIRDESTEITHFVSTGRDVTSRVLADARMEYLANYDVLTRLPNRSLFMDRLGQAIRRCQRNAKNFSLLFIDLDRFKTINDTLGHGIGDQVLAKVAERLSEIVRGQDSVARLGGDEFTIILEGLNGQAAGNRVAAALILAFLHPFEIEGRLLYTGISIGIASYPDDGEDIESLVRHADIAMFHAKSSGRGTYVNFSSVMEGKMLEDLSMEVSLRSALIHGEFEIYYQPIIRPCDRRTVALEALLRWHSPQHGDVPPSRFIPMLEETGLITEVGRWVLHTACAQIKALAQEGFPSVILAVNLSGRQFRDGHLVSDVQKMLRVTGWAPEQLELEITESILIEDAPMAGRTLEALAALGVRLAIDDFGTGYSSLSYLRRFPINTLKIDRSFVVEMESSADAVAIVKTIINLAHNLGLEVVGEGVETPGQLALLSEFGCAKVQGYWFSRPVPLHRLLSVCLALEV